MEAENKQLKENAEVDRIQLVAYEEHINRITMLNNDFVGAKGGVNWKQKLEEYLTEVSVNELS